MTAAATGTDFGVSTTPGVRRCGCECLHACLGRCAASSVQVSIRLWEGPLRVRLSFPVLPHLRETQSLIHFPTRESYQTFVNPNTWRGYPREPTAHVQGQEGAECRTGSTNFRHGFNPGQLFTNCAHFTFPNLKFLLCKTALVSQR